MTFSDAFFLGALRVNPDPGTATGGHSKGRSDFNQNDWILAHLQVFSNPADMHNCIPQDLS